MAKDILLGAFYTASKAGKTGLTPTMTVKTATVAGAVVATLVSAQAMVEVGLGLYVYRVAAADVQTYYYFGVAHTADGTVDAQDVAAVQLDFADELTQLTAQGYTPARAGYLDTLNGLVAAIWGYTSRTITQSLSQLLAVLSGANVITVYRGTFWSIPLTGLGNITTRTKLYFTMKADPLDPDTAAIVQIVVSNPGVGGDGLLRFNGAAGTLADGAIVVNDATLGNITITVKVNSTQSAPQLYNLYWDLKEIIDANSGPLELKRGTGNILQGETAAVS